MKLTVASWDFRVAHWGLSRLNIPEPSEIAELGCGGGRNIRDLLEKYPASHVTGLDYSPLPQGHDSFGTL
ncbi:MAG: class I SAM-dependent methyltransferase [Synergistaceae bacterium]|nr:class I SAM-dependent methyltransferase [Synergistaceae bacterium]